MSAVDEVTKTDEAVLESLDFEVPCRLLVAVGIAWGRVIIASGRKSEPCAEAARWSMRCRSCDVVVTVCEKHRLMMVGDPSAQCGHCGQTARGDALYVVRPLPGGRP